MTTYIPDVSLLNVGLLIARLVLGLGLAAHGAQKLFGWFGGHGLEGTGSFLDSAGFRPGRPLATMAGLGEFAGGILTALGLFGPVGPAAMLAVMLVAMSQHAANGFFAEDGGIERPLLYAAGALALASTGPGGYSLDAALGLRVFETPELVGIFVALAVISAIVVLALRNREATAAAAGRGR
jgi:putative oxidoreductase